MVNEKDIPSHYPRKNIFIVGTRLETLIAKGLKNVHGCILFSKPPNQPPFYGEIEDRCIELYIYFADCYPLQ